MEHGLNIEGFTTMRKPAGTHDIDATGEYSPATGSFPPAEDVSSQDGAGLGNNGK